MEERIEMEDLFERLLSNNDNTTRNFHDNRGFSPIMLASEAGRVDIVQDLMESNLVDIIDVNTEVNGENAINLAYNRGHYEIVLMLLHANSKFPTNFDYETAPHEIKIFTDKSESLHAEVEEASDENIEDLKVSLAEIVEMYPTLRIFYDKSNCSLMKTALESKNIKVSKLLCEFYMQLSPHESFDEIKKNFNDEEKETFRECYEIIFENFNHASEQEIKNFRDCRGYNALMVAAEGNFANVVQHCIERNYFIIDSTVNRVSAATLANKAKNHEILLMLLNANSEFPEDLDESLIDNDKLKKFIKMSKTMHMFIKNGNINDSDAEKIENIIQTYPNLEFFYDLQNRSALRQAIETRNFKVYEILVKNSITHGPYENYDSILSNLSIDERYKLNKIQRKLSVPLVSPIIQALMAHSYLGRDSRNEKRILVIEAYNNLIKFKRIQLIMKIIAAQVKYQIVFDFKHDFVQYIDPNASSFMNGNFHSNGRIYIAAKGLYDEARKFEVASVLAHELCHFAMMVTFRNRAKPFRKSDDSKRLEFERIFEICQERKELEPIVNAVYDCYENHEFKLMELIVRPIQIEAFYTDPEKFQQKRKDFNEVFEYFDNYCIPEMEKIAVEVKNPFESICQLKKFIVGLAILVAFTFILAVITAIIFYNPTLSWKTLTPQQKIKFNNATVSYYGIGVKFNEIYANDSIVYNLITSEQIKATLKGKSEVISKAIADTYHEYVYLKWSNMTKELKDTFINYFVPFGQMEGPWVRLKELTTTDGVLNTLSTGQVKEIFKNNSVINVESQS